MELMYYKKVYGMTDKDFTPIEDKVEKVELQWSRFYRGFGAFSVDLGLF